MHPDLRLPRLLHRLNGLSQVTVFGVACVLELLVSGLDLFTSPLIPFGVYFLLPIGLAAWSLGGWTTGLFIVVSSLVRTYALSSLFPPNGSYYFTSDVISSLFIYTVVAFLVVRLKQAYRVLEQHANILEKEVQTVQQRTRLEASIRRAVAVDVDAIVALAVSGAEDGDLSSDVLTEVRQQALRVTYLSSIQEGAGPRPTWTGEQANVPIELWVSDINGKIAGFFMIMGLDQRKGAERELHAISVAKEYRSLGIGSAMVDFFCSHYYGRRLYAACMPESRMRQMLKRRGFHRYADAKEKYVIVERVEWPKEKGLLKGGATEQIVTIA